VGDGASDDEVDANDPSFTGSGFEDEYLKRLDDLQEQHLDEAQRKVQEHYDTQQAHDTLIDICASAFGPEGPLHEETGYRFLFSEPLIEQRVKNYDVFLYDASGPRSIFVECKSSISNPADVVTDAQEAYQEIQANQAYLEENIGGELGFTEYVVCFPSEMRERMVRHLDNRGDDGYLDEDEEKPLLFWEVNKFIGQKLGLVTRIPPRADVDNQHGENTLTSLLSDSIEVQDAEVFYRAYPSSHPLRLSKEGLAHQMQVNKQERRKLKTVRRDDLEAFFSNPEHVPHYANDEIGEDLTNRVIDHGLEHGLIADDEGELSIDLDVTTMQTILDRYEDEHLARHAEEIARRWAEEDAEEEFREKYPSLEEFPPE